jgi:hypothetical protein
VAGDFDQMKNFADKKEYNGRLLSFPRRHFEELWGSEDMIGISGLATVGTSAADKATSQHDAH